jgi:hypothetical protein
LPTAKTASSTSPASTLRWAESKWFFSKPDTGVVFVDGTGSVVLECVLQLQAVCPKSRFAGEILSEKQSLCPSRRSMVSLC